MLPLDSLSIFRDSQQKFGISAPCVRREFYNSPVELWSGFLFLWKITLSLASGGDTVSQQLRLAMYKFLNQELWEMMVASKQAVELMAVYYPEGK